MKADMYLRLVDEVVAQKLKVVDDFIEEIIEPIGDVGSPEKLIGKPYEEWNELDRQLLAQVYGPGDDSPLAKLIFEKSLKEVQDLEKEA